MKSLLRLMLILVVFAFTSKGTRADDVVGKLPGLLGSNNAGTEFRFAMHPIYGWGYTGSIKLFMTSEFETRVTVEVPGKGYIKTFKTIPNQVYEQELSPAMGFVYSSAMSKPPLKEDEIYVDEGILVKSDDPIVLYAVAYYPRNTDGCLISPVHALGKEYIVASYRDKWGGHWNRYFSSYLTIIGTQPKTTVNFTLGGNDYTETPGGMKAGDTKKFVLGEGDVVVIGAIGVNSELTGSIISASAPVAVLSGSKCAYIPDEVQGGCDYLIEMQLPTNIWGKSYHMPPFPGREKASIIRVFAKEDNTTIYRDGLSMGLIKKAGGIAGEGWLDFRAATSNRPVTFSSDDPISVTQYNTSRDDDNQYSEPAQVTLIPVEQYSKTVDITTPGKGSGGFASNVINIVYESANSLLTNDFELGQLENDKIEWTRLNTLSSGPGQEFLSLTNNKKYYSSHIALPGNGAYKIRANSKFAVYMLGIEGQNVCAYPAACGMIDLTKNDTLAPLVTMKIEDGFVDGQVTDLPVGIDDRSNLAIIYMNSEQSYNCELTHKKLIPGYTRKLDWELDVIDKNDNARAVISFIDRCGNDTTIVYDYNPIKLAITPTEYDFGHIRLGMYKEASFWVHNTAEIGAFTLDSLGFQKLDQYFKIIAEDIPIELQPGDSSEFTVRYCPNESGTYKDSIGAGSEGKHWFKAFVKGSVGIPMIKVDDLSFDSVLVGKSSYKTGEITNIGNYDLEIVDWNQNKAESDFSWELPEISVANPLIIKPNESVIYEVAFSPTVEGERIEDVYFVSNTGRPSDVIVDSIAVHQGIGKKEPINVVDNNDNSKSQLRIIPDPADASIRLVAENMAGKTVEIEIANLLGNTVAKYSNQVFTGALNLSTSALPNGVYFLRIRADNRTYSRKFTVSHR